MGSKVLCVANLSRFAQPVDLDLPELEGVTPVEMLGYVDFPPIGKQPYRLTLGPYGFFWLELHGESKQTEASAGQGELSPLVADSWERLLEGAGRYRLESALLPEYLSKQRWYGGKARNIRSLKIADWMAVPDSNAALTLIEVEYERGEPDAYFLSLALIFGKQAEQLNETFPNAIVSPAISSSGRGVLYDALFDVRACAALLSLIEQGKQSPSRNGFIRGVAGA